MDKKPDKYDEATCVKQLLMKLLGDIEDRRWIAARATWTDLEWLLSDAFPSAPSDVENYGPNHARNVINGWKKAWSVKLSPRAEGALVERFIKHTRIIKPTPSDAETREPAADARALVQHIIDEGLLIPEAAAEIEAFAKKRVEPWREALQALYDEQNGAPLIRHADRWQAAIDKAEKLLSADDVKETK